MSVCTSAGCVTMWLSPHETTCSVAYALFSDAQPLLAWTQYVAVSFTGSGGVNILPFPCCGERLSRPLYQVNENGSGVLVALHERVGVVPPGMSADCGDWVMTTGRQKNVPSFSRVAGGAAAGLPRAALVLPPSVSR